MAMAENKFIENYEITKGKENWITSSLISVRKRCEVLQMPPLLYLYEFGPATPIKSRTNFSAASFSTARKQGIYICSISGE